MKENYVHTSYGIVVENLGEFGMLICCRRKGNRFESEPGDLNLLILNDEENTFRQISRGSCEIATGYLQQ